MKLHLLLFQEVLNVATETVKKPKVYIVPDIPGRKSFEPHCRNMGSKIIRHFSHTYDKSGKVIVVEDKSEDVTKTVAQYEKECGKKNIVAMMKKGADVSNLLKVGANAGSYGNFENMDFHGQNEMSVALRESTEKALTELKAFNEKYGMNLTMEQFVKYYNEGTLHNLAIQSLNAKKVLEATAKMNESEEVSNPKEGGNE